MRERRAWPATGRRARAGCVRVPDAEGDWRSALDQAHCQLHTAHPSEDGRKRKHSGISAGTLKWPSRCASAPIALLFFCGSIFSAFFARPRTSQRRRSRRRRPRRRRRALRGARCPSTCARVRARVRQSPTTKSGSQRRARRVAVPLTPAPRRRSPSSSARRALNPRPPARPFGTIRRKRKKRDRSPPRWESLSGTPPTTKRRRTNGGCQGGATTALRNEGRRRSRTGGARRDERRRLEAGAQHPTPPRDTPPCAAPPRPSAAPPPPGGGLRRPSVTKD